MGLMGIISTIIVGFIVGLLARFFYPGAVNLGFWMTDAARHRRLDRRRPDQQPAVQVDRRQVQLRRLDHVDRSAR